MPANDNFATRTPLNGAAIAVSASTFYATKEAGEPNHAGNTGGHSLWWSWTAPNNGSVTISTTGSSFDTVLAVYTGTALNTLTLIASDDDGGGSLTSRVTINATPNVAYQIAVDGYNGASGNVQLNITAP